MDCQICVAVCDGVSVGWSLDKVCMSWWASLLGRPKSSMMKGNVLWSAGLSTCCFVGSMSVAACSVVEGGCIARIGRCYGYIYVDGGAVEVKD